MDPNCMRPRAVTSRERVLVTSTLSAYLFTALLTPVALADAPKRYRVAVIDIGGNTEPDAADIHYFVEKGLRLSEGQLESSGIDTVLNAGAEANDLQNIAFGMESLQTGRLAFKTQKCDEALDPLSQAVTYFEQSFAFLQEPEPYLEALTLSGVCLSRKGQKDAAVQTFAKAFVVQPDLDVSAYPEVAADVSAAEAQVRDRDLSSVAVTTKPEASRVFVDGRYRGVSPAVRPGLRRGIHFVHVERQGFARKGQAVDTTTGEADVTVSLEQEPARRRGILDGLLPGLQQEFGVEEVGRDGALTRLKSALLVDYAVLLRTTGTSKAKKVELALYDLTSGRRVNQLSTVVNWAERDRAARDAVLALAQKVIDVPLQQAVSVVVPVEPPVTDTATSSSGSTPYYKTWWFWTLIGVGVAGTAVGITFAVLPKDEAPAGIPQDGNGAILFRF